MVNAIRALPEYICKYVKKLSTKLRKNCIHFGGFCCVINRLTSAVLGNSWDMSVLYDCDNIYYNLKYDMNLDAVSSNIYYQFLFNSK